MGNCLRRSSNKILAEDFDEQEPQVELAQPFAPKELEHVRDAKKKNRVKFKLQEEEDDDDDKGHNRRGVGRKLGKPKNGVVRIKLVVTQEELQQILDYKKSDSKFSSVEQLLKEMKLRRTSLLEVEKSDGDYVNGSWSPALESIPEDH